MTTFESKFVDEVAYFRCRGAKVVALRGESVPSTRPTVIFVLEVLGTEDEVAQERSRFLNHQCVVEPRRFAETVKNTTDLLFDELRKRGSYNGKR